MKTGFTKTILACALLAVAAAGCRTPAVKRDAEIERFRAESARRAAELKLDPSAPLTADRCVEIALANGLELRVRRLQLSMQDERVRQSLSDALPKVNASASDIRRGSDALMDMGFGGGPIAMEDRETKAFSLQAVLPVLDWGTTYYGWLAAKDRRKQEKLMLERARQLVERDVRIAHARLAAAQRQEKMGRVAVVGAQELVRVARSLEREGLDSHAATASIEAGLAQVVQKWTELRRGVEAARLRLAQEMSLPPGLEFRIDDRLPPARELPAASEIGAFEDRALTFRPELLAQDRARHAAAAAVKQSLAEFLPHLNLVGGYNWSSMSMLVQPDYFNYGVTMTDSLLNGGRNWWGWKMAKKAVKTEEERTLLLSLGVLYEVDYGLLRLLAAHDSMTASEVVARARMEELKLVASRYRQGFETGAEAARSLANLYLAYLDLDRCQTDYLVAWDELAAAAPMGPAGAVSATGAKLPSLRLSPPVEPFSDVPKVFPGVDLKEYPEIEEMIKNNGAGK